MRFLWKITWDKTTYKRPLQELKNRGSEKFSDVASLGEGADKTRRRKIQCFWSSAGLPLLLLMITKYSCMFAERWLSAGWADKIQTEFDTKFDTKFDTRSWQISTNLDLFELDLIVLIHEKCTALRCEETKRSTSNYRPWTKINPEPTRALERGREICEKRYYRTLMCAHEKMRVVLWFQLYTLH